MGNVLDGVLKCIFSVMGTSSGRDLNLHGESKLREYLDSFNLVQLVSLLEDEFAVVFEYSDLNEDNWATPSKISALISVKKGPR
jgi:acyl carrier protein